MLVHHFLSRSAAAAPDAAAVFDQTGTISYSELDRRANRVAHVLMGRGISAGNRVVLAMENSIDWIASYFGILKAGGVVVPIAGGSRSDRLPHVVRDCTPSACVVDRATLPQVVKVLAGTHTTAFVCGTRSKGRLRIWTLMCLGPSTILRPSSIRQAAPERRGASCCRIRTYDPTPSPSSNIYGCRWQTG
jgi:acyl-CoA synthetase (AMP-forming)/AMP-acid ligase II